MTEDNADFWRGEFGDAYTERNADPALIKSNEWMFRKALTGTLWEPPRRVIEFGANIGLNLYGLSSIAAYATAEFTAVEVNAKACERLRQVDGLNVYETTMLNPKQPWGSGYDLAFTKGVLIHLHPDDLAAAYDALYDASSKWIFIAEYFSPVPVEVPYRGHTGKLFKRDFGFDMLSRFPDLMVHDYGFAWKHDRHAPQDDLNWWLFRKVGLLSGRKKAEPARIP